ncbi:YorP family protein [Metabacillus arenae]|uniref:YorP family protein n=1 Tax=Metabacillus arenae TaxID=2771434 RepID=A0A926RWE2_9BACI|nr:YorP family protein [Metabacillus arenae]MBD1379082.1 YorP family protein [Metabacillus arenae]
MPKYFTFEIGDMVIVNDHSKNQIPYEVGKKGQIISTLEVSQYDYEVLLENGTLCRFREIELNKLYK